PDADAGHASGALSGRAGRGAVVRAPLGGPPSCTVRHDAVTITCADCGATQAIPDLPPGGLAECHRCDRVLARRSERGIAVALACAIGVIILLPPALF